MSVLLQKVNSGLGVPTTSGTGSEVGRSAVISDSETKQKNYFSPENDASTSIL